MPVNLKVTLGTVNYTDWMHVTAAKVSTPSLIAWQVWIDVPISNYNFVIPNLDPENYLVSYYDAPTNSSMGTLVAQLIVNALTGDVLYERRFYTCGGSNPGDPAAGGNSITDPYLINKNVTGVFKEAFRYFKPVDEFTFDDTTGQILIQTGVTFSIDEVVSVEIKYSVANSGAVIGGGTGLYDLNLDVPETSRTLLAAEINTRVRLIGSAAWQSLTLPALSALSVGNGFYFDNTVGGMSVQPKILLPGTDRIRYNGFMAASDLFAEFWVSKGEHLLIKKYDDNYWEVHLDYKGTNVGERLAAGYKGMPGTLPEDGAEIDGNEYGRLWWWIINVLPATHYISDDTGTQVPARRGQFIIKPATKKILMPNTQGLSDKGLADFNAYGTDTANRPYDYPGGYQDEMVKDHTHDNSHVWNETGGGHLASGGNSDEGGISDKTGGVTGGGTEQRVKNNGVIYSRRI